MRITFLIPHIGVAGGIRVVAIHARRLAERGHEVTVVSTPLAQPGLRTKVGSLVRGRGWPVNRRARGTYFDDFPGRLVELDRHRPIVEGDVPDADVVVATWWETALWAAALPARKGAKAHFIQGYEVHVGRERIDATWRLPMHKIVVSQWLADIAVERFGLELPDVVANAVDLEQFGAPARGKQDAPTVGMVYSSKPFKGCDVALEALELARSHVPELRLVAFGAEAPTDDLPLAPGSTFRLRPAQAELAGLYASCDAWLFPSRHEGFGLPILEAMACRTPVIGTPAGAAPELIGVGAGMLVPFDDPPAMASAIERIAGMGDAEWSRLSEGARARAAAHTWEDAAERFERALERAVGEADAAVTGRSANQPAGRISAA